MQQPAKMGYAARYLLETGRNGFQFVCGSIKHRIKQGTFSLDPVFREQMAGQFTQAREQAAQAGVAGFLGLFAAVALSVALFLRLRLKSETQTSSSDLPAKPAPTVEESEFKKLCKNKPKDAVALLNDPGQRPGAEHAQQVLQDIVDGILADMYQKRKLLVIDASVHQNRILLLNTFFQHYNTVEVPFGARILAQLASYQEGIELEDKSPFFAVISKSYAAKAGSEFVTSVLQAYDAQLATSGPAAQAAAKGLKFLVKAYLGVFTTDHSYLVLRCIIAHNLEDQEGMSLFKTIVTRLGKQVTQQIQELLKTTADLGRVALFKCIADRFRTALTLDSLGGILASSKTPEAIKIWILHSFQKRK